MNTTGKTVPPAVGASRTRRVLRVSGRIFLGLIALIVVALIGGSIYQLIVGNVPDGRYAPTGRLIDIGGRALHIHCTGQGIPTVLLEAGLGLGAVTWQHVQPAISEITRVCSYDRAGYGWSSAGPSPRTAARVTEDLHALVERAGLQGPLVLVGHSLGGLFVRHYAAAHAADIAGMVLVDSTHEDQDKPPTVVRALVNVVARAGVTRALFQFDDPGLNAMYKSNRSLGATLDEFAVVEESSNETRQAHLSLRDKPLVVLTAGSNDADPAWRRLQNELASRSPTSKHIVATGSGHYIQDDRPELVIDAVREVVAATKATKP